MSSESFLKGKVLVVDDEAPVRAQIARSLELSGYDVISAADGSEGLTKARTLPIDLLLLDLRFNSGGIQGIEVLQTIRNDKPFLPVIIVSATGGIPEAVRAIKLGAQDYIEKEHLSRDRLIHTVELVLSHQRLKQERDSLVAEAQSRYQILGNSPAIRKVLDLVDRVAPFEEYVLLTGETGTGKSLIARAIHSRSQRVARPFAEINCPTIPSELMESELFGHRKGSFTGAIRDHVGRVAACEGGTLFLDEIGDLPLKLQPKLLRFLQDHEYERIGDTQTRKADVRVIAATNRDIDKMVSAGTFRDDLFFRLNVIRIHVPSLRERREDIPALAEHFLAQSCRRNNRRIPRLTPDAVHALLEQQWKGNIRELENFMSRLTVLCDKETIEVEDILNVMTTTDDVGLTASAHSDYARAKQEFERRYFGDLLIAHDNNVREVADAAGMDKSGTYRKCHDLGLLEKTPLPPD